MLAKMDGQDRNGELTTPMGTAAKFFADAMTGKSDAARDYDDHLTEALRRDLSGVAATRALYVAGDDDRGRKLVVFAPDLVARISNSPYSRRKNYTCVDTAADLAQVPEEGATEANGAAPGSPFHSPHRTCLGSGHSCVRREGSGQVLPASRIAQAVKGRSASVGAAACAAPNPGADPRLSGGGRASLVAGEGNVGSPEMESLLLYFVRLMDKVVDCEFTLLLLCPEGNKDGADEGWVT